MQKAHSQLSLIVGVVGLAHDISVAEFILVASVAPAPQVNWCWPRFLFNEFAVTIRGATGKLVVILCLTIVQTLTIRFGNLLS